MRAEGLHVAATMSAANPLQRTLDRLDSRSLLLGLDVLIEEELLLLCELLGIVLLLLLMRLGRVLAQAPALFPDFLSRLVLVDRGRRLACKPVVLILGSILILEGA